MAKTRMKGEDRKRSIVEAALRVIGRTSFERSTTAMIAAEAGVTEPLIYRHFEGKKDLQLAVLDSILENFLEFTNMLDQIPSLTLRELREHGKVFQKGVRENPLRITVLLKALGVEDQQIKDRVWDIVKIVHRAVEKIVDNSFADELAAKGRSVEMFSWLVLSWVSMVAMINQLGKHGGIPDHRIDEFAEFLDYAIRLPE